MTEGTIRDYITKEVPNCIDLNVWGLTNKLELESYTRIMRNMGTSEVLIGGINLFILFLHVGGGVFRRVLNNISI